MKAIIASDTHENGAAIESIVKFAEEQGIGTIFDAGDLHGAIKAYSGIKNLHAVYWKKASGAMNELDFESNVESIGGTVHQNGSSFCIDELAVFMKHDLAGYENEIPKEALEIAESALDRIAESSPEKKRMILFGHTHNMFYLGTGKSIAINPGQAGLHRESATFAVVDTNEGSVEYRFVSKPEEIVMRIGKDSGIRGFRDFVKSDDGNRYILTLENGNEVFVHGDERTEEFHKIVSAWMKKDMTVIKCQNENGLQQFVIEGKRSKEYARIGQIFEDFTKEDEPPKAYAGFIAGKEIEGVVKEILVTGENEDESRAFDKIVDHITPIIEEGFVCFVGRTHIEGKTGDYDPHIAHLVVNNNVVVEYSDDINSMKKAKGLDTIVVEARTDDQKQLVATVGKDGTLKEGKKYDSVACAEIIDGHLVYAARDGDEKFVVVDGVEQKRHKANPHAYDDKICDISFIAGELAYIVCDKAGKSYSEPLAQTLFHAGREVASIECRGYYSGISRVKEVGGKLAYIVQPDEGNARLVVGGQVVLEKPAIKNFEFIAGRLAYSNGGFEAGYMWEDGSKVDSELMKEHMEAKRK